LVINLPGSGQQQLVDRGTEAVVPVVGLQLRRELAASVHGLYQIPQCGQQTGGVDYGRMKLRHGGA
jgi:hypothetical protein